MNYDVTYFIKKFEALKESDFCVGSRYQGGKRCAYGWCYKTPAEANDSMFYHDGYASEEEKSLHALFNSIGIAGAAIVNNAPTDRYPQPTPKQRILAALYDIKKMQQKDIDTGGKAEPAEKIKTVYVSVPVSITEQAKELITN